MTAKKSVIKVYVSKQDKANIAANARQCRMSVSGYALALVLNNPPIHAIDLDRMDELMKVHADLGRLGGLLKMTLTNDERLNDIGRDLGLATLDGILVDIRTTQARLLELVDCIFRKAKASQ